MKNTQGNKKDNKFVLYLLGYYIIGTIALIINNVFLPLGLVVGAVRLYKFYKKDPLFAWQARAAALLLGTVLSYFGILLTIPIRLIW